MFFERDVNQELFFYILGDDINEKVGEYEYVCDTFEMHEYDWSEPEEPKPNFWHKPSGFKLWWYKYPLRGVETNMDITHEQFRAILYDCRNEIIDFGSYANYSKWWEDKDLMATYEDNWGLPHN